MTKYHTVASLIEVLKSLPQDSVVLIEDPTNGEYNPVSSGKGGIFINAPEDRDNPGDNFYPCPRGEFTGTVVVLRVGEE